MNLSKWSPFKFLRSPKKAEKVEAASAAEAPTPLAAWQDDPFFMLREMMREPWKNAEKQLDRWFGDHSPALFQPCVDVVDEGKALRITAELPGVAKEDLKISVDGDYLTLKGEKRLENTAEEEGCYRIERAYGSFQRLIPLPQEVDREKVEASFDKGVLTVRLPKLTPTTASKKAKMKS